MLSKGGSNFFHWGPNANSIEIHITCDFPWGGGGGGVRTPYPPSGSARDVEH